MQYRITAPVHGHSGVVAGITFAEGVATCCDPPLGALEYFRRHEYAVVCLDTEPDNLIGFTADVPEAPVVIEDTTPKPTPRNRNTGKRASDEG
ncbi:hypothetical protein ACIQNI_08805 [Streptomyces sp. NPDC091266]|uniref:hypothetical protein n=1 Tax=Streptomyces sp. NPDC091266 TaxID=3365978 RepID=UPI0037F4473D